MSTIDPIAEAIKTKLEGLTGLNTYKWSPRDINVPAAVIELPHIERGGPDSNENSPLGLNGWLIDFPVTLYFELGIPADTQAQAVAYLEAFITAIDDDPSLSLANVEDSAVTTSEPVLIDDRNRVLFAYECRLEVLAQVVDNDP